MHLHQSLPSAAASPLPDNHFEAQGGPAPVKLFFSSTHSVLSVKICLLKNGTDKFNASCHLRIRLFKRVKP